MANAFPTLKMGQDTSSNVSYENNLRRVDLGDGYIQRSARGINNVRRTYKVVFSLLDTVDATTLRDFLLANSGGQTVTLPVLASNGAIGKFMIESFQEDMDGPLHRKISVNLIEVFV